MVGLSSTALASRDPSSRATFCVARRVGDARAYTLPVDDAGLATCSAETPAHAGKSAQQYVVGLRRYAAAGGTTRSPRRPRPRGESTPLGRDAFHASSWSSSQRTQLGPIRIGGG